MDFSYSGKPSANNPPTAERQVLVATHTHLSGNYSRDSIISTMAASYTDMYPKRKAELEDITNHHKKARLNKTYYAVQERLPLPTGLESHLKRKVSFELDNEYGHAKVPYETSLLTPKDDDYASELESEGEDRKTKEIVGGVPDNEEETRIEHQTLDSAAVSELKLHSRCSSSASRSVSNGTNAIDLSEDSISHSDLASEGLESDSVVEVLPDSPRVETSGSSSVSDLSQNPDYIALCASGALLRETKRNIEQQLTELQRLRSSAQDGSKQDLVQFYVALLCRQTRLPGQHRIVRAPAVDWGKYHLALQSVALDCTNDYENVFSALNVFRG